MSQHDDFLKPDEARPDELPSDAAHYAVNRRTFLKYSLLSSVLWAGARLPDEAGLSEIGISRAEADELLSVKAIDGKGVVFPQSVASGDPRPSGITLWTRLAPQAAAARLAFEVASDIGFQNIVLRGAAKTDANRDFVVKTYLNSAVLQPFTTYYYRFIFSGTSSRTGRFKTLPAPGADVKQIRFAYVSCQDYGNGYFNALFQLARETIDFVVHLGDYIYETVDDPSFQNGAVRSPGPLPSGEKRAETLEDYRHLYKTYKSDRRLQIVHEQFAFINIWDDHEFANDCHQDFDNDTADLQANKDSQRRSDANRAWAEYTPTGLGYRPDAGPLGELTIYRSFRFGNLMELFMTDERLYRDAHPCGPTTNDKYATPGCPQRLDANRSMLGATQKRWFLSGVNNSPCVWKIWGNEVTVMQMKISNTFTGALFPPNVSQGFGGRTGDVFLNLDQWDGWPAERAEILKTIRDKGTKNFVTITGDIHSFIAGYQKVNFDDPLEAPVATCFVCGSITSANLEELVSFGNGGPPMPRGSDLTAALKASNPHVEYLNSSTHGYNLMDITPARLICTMRAVSTIKSQSASFTTLKRFQVPRDRVLIQEL